MLAAAQLWQPFHEFVFMRRALIGGLLLACSTAPLGVFLILRRMSLIGDAVAHGILPGAALGFWFAGLSLPALTVGGLGAGLGMADWQPGSLAEPACGKMRASPRSIQFPWPAVC